MYTVERDDHRSAFGQAPDGVDTGRLSRLVRFVPWHGHSCHVETSGTSTPSSVRSAQTTTDTADWKLCCWRRL
jgi:hypothetical protein